nr:MAG TPA: hypothetical protein [Caudoviricetes sp.]
MKGYLEEINNRIEETTSELTKKLKSSEQTLNKKDISNKETLIMIFEEMESLKLRIKTLEDAAGITFTAPAKKDEMLSEDFEEGEHL